MSVEAYVDERIDMHFKESDMNHNIFLCKP